MLLKEQGFQQCGSCSGSDCLVEVGQLLGVQKLFLGEILQVGGLLTLTLRRRTFRVRHCDGIPPGTSRFGRNGAYRHGELPVTKKGPPVSREAFVQNLS